MGKRNRVDFKLGEPGHCVVGPISLADCGRGGPRKHTPSIAFRHLPPNSARFGCAIEGALSARSPKGLRTDKTVEATYHPGTHVNMRRIHPGLKKEEPSRFKRLWFSLCWYKLCWRL